ncbi:hypothetical protein [Frateuria terrea]|uniref:Uncharacterized protein n=1 Tax=Frateuria terrea TaxID=529704 RepID=A0A1H6ZH17_9GAMM|nr:hypothetical protein [Frateuria terrea]SEJ50797.1 hypothetical protein SAMN04487997_0038 [Frateuria terrea]SFP79052.1 hypothetical protein SAMN02927913_0038 [Frateuria terrea]
MPTSITPLVFATTLLAAGTALAAHPNKASDAKLIASAMRAAPAAVGRHATIMAMQPDGSMRTLRQGTNGFTCIPDAPSTPGQDPMCADKSAMAWIHAWATHATPPSGQVGLMYMLEGGTDASNTDPYARTPQGKHWIKTGPHLMVVGADTAFYDQYPKLADPQTDAPYVMWAGTPYQHLMAPIR